MAKCEKRPVEEPKYEYILTLTAQEAFGLRSLLNCVIGDDKGPRGLVTSLWDALRDEGVGYSNTCFTGQICGVGKWPKEAPNA